MANKFTTKMILILLNILSFFIEYGSGLWCFQCSEIDGSIKCPQNCDYIKKWKNCELKNHYVENVEWEFNNSYCIVGAIGQTIMYQVSRKQD